MLEPASGFFYCLPPQSIQSILITPITLITLITQSIQSIPIIQSTLIIPIIPIPLPQIRSFLDMTKTIIIRHIENTLYEND